MRLTCWHHRLVLLSLPVDGSLTGASSWMEPKGSCSVGSMDVVCRRRLQPLLGTATGSEAGSAGTDQSAAPEWHRPVAVRPEK
jgi:hypothetical protein